MSTSSLMHTIRIIMFILFKFITLNKNKGKKYIVNRLKGLGEMSVEETAILVDPDKRIIKQITVEDAKQADILFDQLMGDSVIPRKQFIKEHSAEATYGV